MTFFSTDATQYSRLTAELNRARTLLTTSRKEDRFNSGKSDPGTSSKHFPLMINISMFYRLSLSQLLIVYCELSTEEAKMLNL